MRSIVPTEQLPYRGPHLKAGDGEHWLATSTSSFEETLKNIHSWKDGMSALDGIRSIVRNINAASIPDNCYEAVLIGRTILAKFSAMPKNRHPNSPESPCSAQEAEEFLDGARRLFVDRSLPEYWAWRYEASKLVGEAFIEWHLENMVRSWRANSRDVRGDRKATLELLDALDAEFGAMNEHWPGPTYRAIDFSCVAIYAYDVVSDLLDERPSPPTERMSFTNVAGHLKHLRAMLAPLASTPPTPALSESEEDVLRAMIDKDALDQASRRTSTQIAMEACGSYSNSWTKQLLRELAAKGFVLSLKGSKGGYWLTEQGTEHGMSMRP